MQNESILDMVFEAYAQNNTHVYVNFSIPWYYILENNSTGTLYIFGAYN